MCPKSGFWRVKLKLKLELLKPGVDLRLRLCTRRSCTALKHGQSGKGSGDAWQYQYIHIVHLSN